MSKSTHFKSTFRHQNFFEILYGTPCYQSKKSRCWKIITWILSQMLFDTIFCQCRPCYEAVTAGLGDQTRFKEFYRNHFGHWGADVSFRETCLSWSLKIQHAVAMVNVITIVLIHIKLIGGKSFVFMIYSNSLVHTSTVALILKYPTKEP